MRNVTISLDEKTAGWARVEAAKRDMSVSRFVGELLRHQMEREDDYDRAKASYRRRSAVRLKQANTSYPSRAEVHMR